MKNILTVAAFLGISMPALASTEFNYSAVDAGYSTTNYSKGGGGTLTELGLGISKSIPGNAYLGVAYQAGSQLYSDAIYTKKTSISGSAGYHVPVKDDVDAVAEGHIILGSVKRPGFSASANGYDIGAGIRTLLRSSLEGTFLLIHANTSNGVSKRKNTFISARLEVVFTPELHMTARLDYGSDVTSGLGLRFFY